MVYLNDMLLKGIFNATDHMKHQSAVQQTLPTQLNGSSNNVWCHKNEFIHQMESTSLRIQSYHLWAFTSSQNHSRTMGKWPMMLWEKQLSTWLMVIMLPLVKAMRDMILLTLATMTHLPMTASQAEAIELSLQTAPSVDCQVIVQFMDRNSQTHAVKHMMDVYKEDHKVDGIIMWMCFLQEYAGSSHEAFITAEEALHPSKLELNNFQHNNKNVQLISTKTSERYKQ